MTTAPHKPPTPDTILEAMKDIVRARRKWDEAPGLGFLYRITDTSVRPSELKIPESIWSRAQDPKNVLRFFKGVLDSPTPETAPYSAILRNDSPRELCGMFLRVEGWGPPMEQMEEIHRRRMAGGSFPRFETMPDRREFRMCSAVDAEDRQYMVMQERNDSELVGVYDGMKDAHELAGDIPDLLRDVVRLMLMPTGAGGSR